MKGVNVRLKRIVTGMGRTIACLAFAMHSMMIAAMPAGAASQPDTTFHGKLNALDTLNSSGRYVEVNQVFVMGNKITRNNIITRELTLKQGTIIYNQDIADILERDEKKLLNTRLFNTASIRAIDLEPGLVDIIVEVDERWYTFPVPIFELSDRNFNEWWQNYDHDFKRVNYGLKLYQNNMRGRNEMMKLAAQFGYSKRFQLSYRMPYIDKNQQHGLTFEFSYIENKNLAFQTTGHKLDYLETHDRLRTTKFAAITYTYRNSFYDYHNIGIAYHDVEVGDTIVQVNPNYLGEGVSRLRYAGVFYEFIDDHRDVVSYPLRGHYFYLHAEQLGLGNDNINKTDAYAGFAGFKDLRGGFYLSNFTFGFWSRQEGVPYAFYSALGYQRLFPRGFERYVIEGPRFGLNKLTIKKRVFSRTYNWGDVPIRQFRHIPISLYLKVYGDVAYVENYPGYIANEMLSDRLIGGTGIGVDLVGSYDLVFRVEYSINSINEHGIFLHMKKEF